MLGGEVKDDAVAGVAQELLARGHRLEDATLALDAEVAVESDGRGDQAHDRFGTMDIEVVHHEMPGGFRRARGKQPGEVVREVLLGPGLAEVVADRPGGHIEIGDERGGTVADVLELGALGPAGTHRLRRRSAFERLHARHLVDAARLDPGGRPLGGELISLADIATLGGEVGVSGGVDPAVGTMGLELDLTQEAPNGVGRDALDDALLARRRRQRGLAPMGEGPPALARRLTGQSDDLADLLGLECRRGTRTRRIAQSLGERLSRAGTPASAPALHGRAPKTQFPSRLVDADTRIGQQDDARTHHQALRRMVLSHDGFKTVTVFRGQIDGDSSAAGHGEQVQADES